MRGRQKEREEGGEERKGGREGEFESDRQAAEKQAF